MKTNEEWIEEFEETVATGKIFDEDGNEITIEIIGFLQAKDEQARIEKIELIESVPCESHKVGWIGYGNGTPQKLQKLKKDTRDRLINEIEEWKQEQLKIINQ